MELKHFKIKEKRLFFIEKQIDLDKRINEILSLNNKNNVNASNALYRLFIQKKENNERFNAYLNKNHFQN